MKFGTSALVTITLLNAGCGSAQPAGDMASTEMADCRREGVAYYTVIGSYPTLSTGKSADDLIEEKCAFNPRMFKDMNL